MIKFDCNTFVLVRPSKVVNFELWGEKLELSHVLLLTESENRKSRKRLYYESHDIHDLACTKTHAVATTELRLASFSRALTRSVGIDSTTPL